MDNSNQVLVTRDSDLIYPVQIEQFESEYFLASIGSEGGYENEEDEFELYGISEFVVLRVTKYNSSISSSEDIELQDENQGFLGLLCLSCSPTSFIVNEMTVPRYISYLIDTCGASSPTVNVEHTFSNSYLLVPKDSFRNYMTNYKNGAPIWGGFTHSEPGQSYSSNIRLINAKKGLDFPLEEHRFKLDAAVDSSDCFDRFLKKYHLLELIYDYLCVLKLRTMDSNIRDFRSVMNDYAKEEIKSLKSLLKEYVNEPEYLLPAIYEANNYKSVVESIFQTNSKDSNPLAKEEKWNIFWEKLENNKLSFATINEGSKLGVTQNAEKYKEFITNLVAYWIYRIRCSIAHTKIGEYIFTPNDEEFIAVVGERLIDLLISVVYSNVEFKTLVSKSNTVMQALSECTD